jgi:hypothetical protein
MQSLPKRDVQSLPRQESCNAYSKHAGGGLQLSHGNLTKNLPSFSRLEVRKNPRKIPFFLS